MVVYIFVVATLLLLLPTGSLARPGSSTSDSATASEDIDTILVPLEPDLTVTPPELVAAKDKSDNHGEAEGQSPAPDSAAPLAQAPESTTSDRTTASTVTTYNIPVVIDPSVQRHIHFFNTSIRSRFEQWLVRFNRYRPLVEDILVEFNLPTDLMHLSLVESGFNPHAYSRSRATGPWQFMKRTGKHYGLRIDRYVDERRDPIKSTVAAARYLRDLYDLFGTWPLAMAAYNAGEGRVMRALHKAKAETFSDISKTRLIRRETKQYVPRIMAATVIARNSDEYGFSQEPVTPHQFEEVVVTRPLHFRAIAKFTGIPYKELRLLNPELRRNMTPPNDSTYYLKVPVGTSAKVMQQIERIPTYKFRSRRLAKSKHVKADSSQWYRVRVGDTLGKIAKRFRIPLKTLKTRNKLSGHLIWPGDFLIITR